MTILSFLRPHARWQRLLDRSLDGDLSPADQVAFDGHRATCPHCRAAYDESKTLSTLLRALPDREAPRSFRLTSAMLEAPRPAMAAIPAPRREAGPASLFVLRTAQAASGLAAAALVGAVLVGLAGSAGGDDDDDGSGAPAAAIERSGAYELSGQATAAAAATSASELTDSASPAALATATVPPFNPGGGSAAGGVPTPQPTQPAPPRTGVDSQPTAATTGVDAAATSAAAAKGGPDATRAPDGTTNTFGDAEELSSTSKADRDSEDENGFAFGPLEWGLVALLVSAAAATLGVSLYRRRADA